MKQILTLLLSLISFYCFPQKKLPVVTANSDQAKIYEQGNLASNWRINPKIKVDVFTTGKLTRSKTITFKTDADSIRLRIKPGQQKDFIVLLNGKDSCLTRIQSSKTKNLTKCSPAIHDSIPFFVNTYNTNFLPVILDGTDSLILNFDTGATEVDLTTDALKTKVKSHPKLYTTSHNLTIGDRIYKSKIYDIKVAGNETDGLLGWNVFDGMIVELDYDKHKMILHSIFPKRVLTRRGYSKFKIKYIKNKPFIESTIAESGTEIKSWFLFDLGYQRTVMLDNDLLRAARFPTEKMKVIKKVVMHGTKGNEIPVTTTALERLTIGTFDLKNLPAQLMEQNKPMAGATIHILGTDVLKRFNTVLDFQKDLIYLKPNSHY